MWVDINEARSRPNLSNRHDCRCGRIGHGNGIILGFNTTDSQCKH